MTLDLFMFSISILLSLSFIMAFLFILSPLSFHISFCFFHHYISLFLHHHVPQTINKGSIHHVSIICKKFNILVSKKSCCRYKTVFLQNLRFDLKEFICSLHCVFVIRKITILDLMDTFLASNVTTPPHRECK